MKVSLRVAALGIVCSSVLVLSACSPGNLKLADAQTKLLSSPAADCSEPSLGSQDFGYGELPTFTCRAGRDSSYTVFVASSASQMDSSMASRCETDKYWITFYSVVLRGPNWIAVFDSSSAAYAPTVKDAIGGDALNLDLECSLVNN
jgi:hypothetical protein